MVLQILRRECGFRTVATQHELRLRPGTEVECSHGGPLGIACGEGEAVMATETSFDATARAYRSAAMRAVANVRSTDSTPTGVVTGLGVGQLAVKRLLGVSVPPAAASAQEVTDER